MVSFSAASPAPRLLLGMFLVMCACAWVHERDLFNIVTPGQKAMAGTQVGVKPGFPKADPEMESGESGALGSISGNNPQGVEKWDREGKEAKRGCVSSKVLQRGPGAGDSMGHTFELSLAGTGEAEPFNPHPSSCSRRMYFSRRFQLSVHAVFQQFEGSALTKRLRCWLLGMIAHPELASSVQQGGRRIPGDCGGNSDSVCYSRPAPYC